MNRVLQAPVTLLDNVPAMIIGLVPNVINVQLDGPNQIVTNVQQVGLGIIVTNVILIQAIVDSHIAQVSKSNVNCLFCLLLTSAVLNICSYFQFLILMLITLLSNCYGMTWMIFWWKIFLSNCLMNSTL